MLDAFTELRIVPFDDDRVSDPGSDQAPLPLARFEAARALICEACRMLAPTAQDLAGGAAATGTHTSATQSGKATYRVRQSPTGNERYIYVDILKRSGMSVDWISSVAEALEKLPFWGVVVPNIGGGQLLVFSNIVLVSAALWSEGADLRALVIECRRGLKET